MNKIILNTGLQNKIYYQNDNCILFNGDCLDIMKELPDNFVDLIITDPPYNIGDNNKTCKQGDKITTNKDMWGHFEPTDTKEWLNFLDMVFSEIYRINKGSLYIFYDRFEITRMKDMLESKGFHPKNLLAIIKKNPLPSFRKVGFRSDYELCLYMQKNKGKDTFNFLSQNEMKSTDTYAIGKKDTKHPTEKPVKIIEKYIKISSNEGDIVLDPFAGSGTTGVASLNLKRHCIMIEKDPAYCEMIKQRVEKGTQYCLF
jgi:DNA modification methylase